MSGLPKYLRALKLHTVFTYPGGPLLRFGPTPGRGASLGFGPTPGRGASLGFPILPEARDPGTSDAVSRGRPGISEELFGQNCLEFNSERIYVSFSRN